MRRSYLYCTSVLVAVVEVVEVVEVAQKRERCRAS
jgi:hypothetical protein